MRRFLLSRLGELAKSDERLFLLVGDLGYSVVEDFESSFPDRFLNFGVSEQAGMGIAAGLAGRFLPVFYSIANFASFRCLEQIRNDVAHEGHPVMIVSLGAGFAYGTAGYSHHGIEDASAVAAIGGMRVVTPACVHELDAVLSSHLLEPMPLYLRLGSLEDCDRCIPSLEVHRSKVKKKNDRRRVLLVSHGEIGRVGVEAAESLGIDHISMPEFNNFEKDFLEFVGSYRSVITVEENRVEGGFGSRLRTRLANHHFDKFLMSGVSQTENHLGGSRAFHLERNRLTAKSLKLEIGRALDA